MSEGFRGYPKNFLLAGLFLIAMISFAVIIAGNYGHSEELVKSDKIDFSALEEQINQTNTDAERWAESFKSDNPLLGFGSLVLYSIWGIGKLMWGAVVTILHIYLVGLGDVIGISPIVIGSITAIVIVGLIFYLWRAIKSGE